MRLWLAISSTMMILHLQLVASFSNLGFMGPLRLNNMIDAQPSSSYCSKQNIAESTSQTLELGRLPFFHTQCLTSVSLATLDHILSELSHGKHYQSGQVLSQKIKIINIYHFCLMKMDLDDHFLSNPGSFCKATTLLFCFDSVFSLILSRSKTMAQSFPLDVS